MEKKTRFSWMLASGLIMTGVIVGATEYFYRTAVKRTTEKTILERSSDLPELLKTKEEQEEELKWLSQQETKHVTLNSEDGLKLHALYIPARLETLKCVILAHGYTGEGKEMLGFARLYAEKLNYNVLIPDARGHGKSDGDYIGFGWHERHDYVKWIHFLLVQFGRQASIVLHGISMGGATVLMTSGESLPKQVKAIISDCAYTSAADVLKHQLKELYQLPAFPFLPLASLYTKIRIGYSFYEASAIKQVKNSTVPILLIHGEEDTFVPFKMVYQLHQAGKDMNELLVIPGAEHGMSFSLSRDLYEEKMRSFLGKYVR